MLKRERKWACLAKIKKYKISVPLFLWGESKGRGTRFLSALVGAACGFMQRT